MEFMKMRDKAIQRADSLGLKPADLARAMTVHPSRVSEWANVGIEVAEGERKPKPWKPNVWQAMALARFLRVELESLIDDEMELVSREVDADDQFVIRTYHALGLTADDAVRLLNSAVAKPVRLPMAVGERFGDQPSPDQPERRKGSG
jgi:hypothetical protein